MSQLRERIEKSLHRVKLRADGWRPIGPGFWLHRFFIGRLRYDRELVYHQDHYGNWWYRYE